MALYLVQHGKSLPKEADPEQGLSPEGEAETRSMAELAAGQGLTVARILHSGKKRARQTAEILGRLLKTGGSIAETPGLKPLDDVQSFARNLDPGEDLMLVGHLPFMERMAGYLVTGSPEKTVIKFQNSGIVCLDREADSGPWWIRWALVPAIN